MSAMSSYSPPKPHVRRERARFEELERVSRGELRDRPTHRKSGSGSGSTSSSSPEARGSPQQRLQTSTSSSTNTTTQTSPTYPNYYDYSENTEIISPAKQREQQQALQTPPQRNNAGNMAMQVPVQPYSQQPSQQPHSPSRHSSNSASAAATPRQGPGPTNLNTAQLQQAIARGDSFHNNNKLNGTTNAANTNGQRISSAGNRPPSFASSTGGPRSPGDDIFPPNKVDIDAARFRHAQQAQSRRERGSTTSDRDRPPPPAKDPRDSRRPSQSNGRPASMNMGLPHQHNGGRPASPESLRTPTGHGNNIVRLATPSIPNSVLQPLDAKVVEYGSLMTQAQGEMARLDEEMRLLQDRQREAEQRFLEAKAKHDDYRRQYHDVERALRGEFASVNGHGRDRRDQDPDDNNGEGVPPTPSMPNLQQYGVDSRQGSGMALNGNQGHPGMRSQRTVSIQSDMEGDMSRPGSKRGRFSRLFGV